MLVVAALVPETALLVPGAAGTAEVLPEARAAALDAVRSTLAAGCRRVVVVAPGARDRTLTGPVRAGLGAAGIPDRWLEWPAPAGAGQPVGVAASVSLLLLARSGWDGPTDVIEVGPGAGEDGRAARLRAVGADAVRSATAPVGLVVAGSLSARHGPDAPLAQDPRADGWDTAVLADLADGSAEARARLAGLHPLTAQELAVSGWGPWQVLLGAVEATLADASDDARSDPSDDPSDDALDDTSDDPCDDSRDGAPHGCARTAVESDVRAVPSTGSGLYVAGTWCVVGAASDRPAPERPAHGAVR